MLAFTRAVSPAFADCELTHLPRVPIDIDRARAQHDAYERTLERLGCTVQRLPADATMPDAVFIEDTAVVLDEIIVIARPGAPSRQAEVADVAEALKHHRLLGHIEAPGTLDGGDVLVAGRTIFVGQSRRTNASALAQFARIAEHFGYAVCMVPIERRLHLKSAVTALGDDALLVDPSAVGVESFRAFDLVEVDPSEPAAANVLRVGRDLVAAQAGPRTNDRLRKRGYEVAEVDVSEIAKAEGAVTCCSLILRQI
jgi:dimethylargininase